MKRCGQCKKAKKKAYFYNGQWLNGGWCKACCRINYANRRDKVRWQRLLLGYGLSQDAYMSMLKAQGEVCAICKQPERAERFKFLAVDHDHRTKAVRGLLCHRCNAGLGNFYDRVELLREAANYLDGHETNPAQISIHKREVPSGYRKLTGALVQEIWGRHEYGECAASIARRSGISRSYISKILGGTAWRGSKDGIF